MRQICTTSSKMDVLLVLCLILLSYGLHVAGCCHATRWQQIPNMRKAPCVCFYSDSCCAPPYCTEQVECFCFFYLQALVPNLEEAVPGPCCHCHAVVGHTQAAHPVVVTRQDTCGEATGWDAVWAAICQVRLWKRLNLQYDAYRLEMSQLFALESGPES